MSDARRVTARLPEAFHRMVEMEANESGLSISGLIREAIIARVLLGRAIRGESLYVAGYTIATAMRETHDPEAEHPGEVARVVRSILQHAPSELDAILERLDQTDKPRAEYCRHLYAIPPNRWARDSMLLKASNSDGL